MNKPAIKFEVSCPEGCDSGTVSIDLNNLNCVTCSDCGEDFDPRKVAVNLAEKAQRWAKVVRWIDMAGSVMNEE